ncbi:MAG: hypothetical protein WAK56_19305 [Candidatus Sulfotelmatobacter sp.]
MVSTSISFDSPVRATCKELPVERVCTILARVIKARAKASLILLAAATSAFPARCSAQAVPSRDQWGEKFNSPGAKLIYKETARTRIQGRTVTTYSLFATGLPKDGHYILWVLNVLSDPKATADAYLNEDGKVASVLADPAHHVAEDPINVKASGGRGEPVELGLISDDGRFRAFAQIVPFPMEASSGPCHLSAVETGPYYFSMFIRASGFQPNEELMIENQSENEGAETSGKADDNGGYDSLIFPFVKGKRSGKARFYISAKSCQVGIEFPWGEGSYHYQ